jgi:archaeal type IV pilus assembly protein PilA
MRPGRDYSEAVSPVVGVMLMLAVTVMIAAVVSTYAGGFSDGAEKTPQSTIRTTPDLGLHRIYFEHNGGDPFTISSINVVLRSGDNKTSLSANDVGGNKLKAFEEVGSNSGKDTAVMAGDTFFIEGEGIGSGTGMKFGNMILTNNTQITWLIVDRETSKTISMGSFYL